MGNVQPGLRRAELRRAGSSTGGGGGGSITSVASADGTLTVTGGTGPAVDLSVNFGVPYQPTVAAMQHSGVAQQLYAPNTATPSILTMVAGQIPFGASTGVLTQSSNLSWDDTNTVLTLQGPGAATVAVVNYRNTTNGTAFISQRYFWNTSTQIAQQIVTHTTTPTNSASFIINQGAAASLDNYTVRGTPFPAGSSVGPLVVYTQLNDVLIGSDAQLAQGATQGFAWFPTIATAPNGTPAFNGITPAIARRAFAIDDTNLRFYSFASSAWHYAQMMDYDPTATRIPFGGATAHTLVDSSALTYTDTAASRNLTINYDPTAASPARFNLIRLNASVVQTATTTTGIATYWQGTEGIKFVGSNNNGGTTQNPQIIFRNDLNAGVTTSLFSVFSQTVVGGLSGGLVYDLLNADTAVGTGSSIPLASTHGFTWFGTFTGGTPSGVPSGNFSGGSRVAMAFQDNASPLKIWGYSNTSAAWFSMTFDSYTATSTRVPFGGATAGSLTDASTLTYASGSQVLTVGGVTVNGSSGTIRGVSGNFLNLGVPTTGDAITIQDNPTNTVSFTSAYEVDFTGTIFILTSAPVSFGTNSRAANGSVATALGSLGPTGSHTTVQEWLKVLGAGGSTRYIPMF